MKGLKKYFLPQAFAALAGGLLTLLVVCYPIGVANNGDFDRVIGPAGLSYLTEGAERYFHYVDEHYRINFSAAATVLASETQQSSTRLPDKISVFDNVYITTHVVWVWLTVAINALFSNTYNIRILSAFYGIVFIFALFLGIGGITKRYGRAAGWILSAAAVFMFCDISYLAYFNSFYGEAASYVFLMLAAGALLSLLAADKPRLWQLVAYWAGAVMLVGAKQQNAMLAVLFLGIAVRLFFLYKDKIWRRVTVIFSAVMVVVSVFTMVFVSHEIYRINIHQAVFFGILRLSDDPAKDLDALQLSRELTVLAGHTYYENDVVYPPDSEYLQREFFDKISYSKIMTYYLTHPARLWQAMEKTAKSAYEIMPGYLGSYVRAAGFPPGMTAEAFAPYDRLRQFVFARNPFPLVVTILAYLLAAVYAVVVYVRAKNKKTRALLEFLAAIAVMGALQFAMPYIADGDGDLNKHLFLFNVAADILIFSGIAAACVKCFKKPAATLSE